MSALLTPLAALMALAIAVQQWRTARNKLKLDLFDKRYAMFTAARTVLAKAQGTQCPSDSDLAKFVIATIGARWIFNAEIEDYLNHKIRDDVENLQLYDLALTEENDLDERKKIIFLKNQLKTRLMGEFTSIADKFSPFLQLSH